MKEVLNKLDSITSSIISHKNQIKDLENKRLEIENKINEKQAKLKLANQAKENALENFIRNIDIELTTDTGTISKLIKKHGADVFENAYVRILSTPQQFYKNCSELLIKTEVDRTVSDTHLYKIKSKGSWGIDANSKVQLIIAKVVI